MNPGRHHHRSQAVALSNYPVNGLHSLPTFTRPYFASLPRSGSEISIVSTKSAAAERLVDSIPLVKRNPPPMKPLHHVYSSMRDARFGKVRDLEADMFSFAPLESSPSLAASVKTTPKSSPLRKSPTAPRISSPLASPATKESSSELEFQDDDDDDFRIRMPLLDKSRLKDALPQDWISHYDPASTTEDKDGSSEISSIKKACLNGSEEDNEEDIGIESDDCGQHETPSRPHHSLFTSTPDASPEARPFTLQRHRHGPTQFEDSEELLQNNDSGETTDNIADSGLSATAAMAASQHKLERFIIYRVVFWIMIWWIGSAFLFAIIEDHWTLLDGFYFTFTTMATVGYGDLSLRSPWSWEVWYFFIFQGVIFVIKIICY